MLKKLESLRRSEDGRALFYVIIGGLAGLILGLLLAPKFVGCFNGSWNTSSNKNTEE